MDDERQGASAGKEQNDDWVSIACVSLGQLSFVFGSFRSFRNSFLL